MKTLKTTCVAAALIGASLTARAASLIHVQVPYAFVAGGVTMPAGTYLIQQQQPSGIVTLRGDNGRSVSVLSRPGLMLSEGARTELRFASVHGQMVLTEVRDAGETSRVLPAAMVSVK